jgi:DNA-binding transcriptional LysR family regulator
MLRNTWDGIEALAALEQYGTVSEAAVRLRLTQSGVSKRIQALQEAVGFRIVEPDGRRLRLTAEGLRLLGQARPLVAGLRALTGAAPGVAASAFSLAIADSIAASWGPGVIAEALKGMPGLRIDLHAHRSVLLIESVRLGRYHIGMSTDAPAAKDLVHCPVFEEPMTLVHAGCRQKPGNGALITIEESSATWRAIEPALRRYHADLAGRQIIPVETFSTAMQMVKSGFGDGLCPLGLVLEMKLDRRCYRVLPHVTRHVTLLTRKTVNQLASFVELRDRIIAATETYFQRRRHKP